MCRSRRELSNEYLLAKIGVDTAENEPLEVWGKIIQYYSFVFLASTRPCTENSRRQEAQHMKKIRLERQEELRYRGEEAFVRLMKGNLATPLSIPTHKVFSAL